MSKIKYILILLLGVGIGVIGASVLKHDYVATQAIDRSTLVAPAHIPSTEYPDMEKIYTDTEKDVSIYLNKNYNVSKVEVNTEVLVDDYITGKILEITKYGFVVSVDDFSEIVYGLSGTQVYTEDGIYLGFVSAINGKGKLDCISY